MELKLGGRGKQCFLAIPSTELVVVGLQQGLGDITLLTAGQVLTGALWLTTAAATTATATAATAAAAAAAAAGQIGVVGCSPVRWGLLLEEGADLLEGGSAGGLQGPAGLHDAVSETEQKLPVGLGPEA